LQAANEELLTANEELQSSTEELQSVNEELYTVNTEHQLKLDELTLMTNDLSNFLSSTMIGIVFVDSDLNIRKFTEYVGREFQLMDHDVGRPIRIFAHSFPNEEIELDCHEVLRSLLSIDREVTAVNGRHYTLRIAPYRTMENSIRGLVITIIDSLGSEESKSSDDAPDKSAADTTAKA
ncbi:MAG: PAS domain-containing protein, partial [Eubacteriales bacterium]|nr:PAS domain-containing protein [Eubacteriales bacterium]